VRWLRCLSVVVYSRRLVSLCVFFFFFFSSRRRHTRCYRDWSSDVCSSDLISPAAVLKGRALPSAARSTAPAPGRRAPPPRRRARSEERRVGKECRYRVSTGHETKSEVSGKHVQKRPIRALLHERERVNG